MTSSYHRPRYRKRRYISERQIEAIEQARQSVTLINSMRTSRIALPDRIFDWLGYPFQKRAFHRLLQEKFEGFPWLAKAWADYRTLEAERKALDIASKKWPAPKAAAEVREIGKKRAEAEQRARTAVYILTYYETLFPWLVQFRDEDIDELLVEQGRDEEEDIQKSRHDPARQWLTEAEYQKLPRVEKFQLALDRYRQKKKFKWELGRDYERYIGHLYEKRGYAVYYQGIVEGLDDLGRDLICTKDNSVEIIQCKFWSKEKQIHEKHIFQLYGTVIAHKIDNPKTSVSACFTTSTTLSERAKQFADELSIRVYENCALEPYPIIKCNVSRRDGTKIYHLPFDQQYDRTLIENERNECYVETVAKAEQLGFRRAYRWRGKTSE